MLPPDALIALENLPVEEAIRRPIQGHDTVAARIAGLLGASSKALEPTTVGDALFRWARTEPESLADADIPGSKTLSDMLSATQRLPKRFGFLNDVQRIVLASEASIQTQIYGQVMSRSYAASRLIAHLHEAQGCEAAIGSADGSEAWLLINGLNFAVHDPMSDLPAHVDKPTFLVQDVVNRVSQLSNHPLVYALGMTSSVFQTVAFDSQNLCAYVGAAAQASQIVMSRDTDALMRLSGVASTAAAGHAGHMIGHLAGIAVFGLAGSWMVILAPIGAGFAGRVVARNLMRRTRFLLFCRNEVAALNESISKHCSASSNVIEESIKTADTHVSLLLGLYNASAGPAKIVIGDWLDRLKHIQSYRKLVKSKLNLAAINPPNLDRIDHDPLSAAQESLIIGARSGIHPANVATSAGDVVKAATALHRKMSSAIV